MSLYISNLTSMRGHVAAAVVAFASACGVGYAQTPPAEKSLNVQLLEFAKRGDEMRARNALDAGAAPDSRNRAGETALYMFAREGRLSAVVLLLERGASVDLAALNKTTPLMAAAVNGHTEVMRALLNADADIRAVDQIDKTAADIARESRHPQVAELLAGS